MEEILTKTCTKCKQELHLSCFSKDSRSKSKIRHICKQCDSIRHKSKYLQEKKLLLEYQKNYYLLNKDKVNCRTRKYYEENKEEILNKQRKYSKENLSRFRHVKNSREIKRRCRKMQACPKWMTKEDFEYIKDLYEACRAFKLFTGLTYHVDHIVPLRGKKVCGLHVPWNLQILEEKDNLRKSNKFSID